MNHFLGWLLQNAILAGIGVPVVWCLAYWRHHRPAEQHLLWTILAIKLVLPPVFVLNLPGPVSELVVSPPTVQATTTVSRTPTTNSLTPENELVPAHAVSISIWDALIPCALGVWGVGVLYCACVATNRIAREVRLIRRSQLAPVEIVQSVNLAARLLLRSSVAVRIHASLKSPVALWWRMPTILWPSTLTPIDRGASYPVLLHELAHLRRGDHLLVWLELLISLVHWWNPVFWFIRRQLHETREMACDAIALENIDGGPSDYVELLMRLTLGGSASMTSPQLVGVRAVSTSSLKRRIAMIFNRNVNGRLSAIGLVVTAGLFLLCLAGFCQVQGQRTKQTSHRDPDFGRAMIFAGEGQSDQTIDDSLLTKSTWLPVLVAGLELSTESEQAAVDLIESIGGTLTRDGRAAGKPATVLFLDRTKVEDKDLKTLSALSTLKVLNLFGCKVSDEGLAELTGMKELQAIDLRETAVTDKGLTSLHKLKTLRSVLVNSTISDMAIAELRKAMPDCKCTR